MTCFFQQQNDEFTRTHRPSMARSPDWDFQLCATHSKHPGHWDTFFGALWIQRLDMEYHGIMNVLCCLIFGNLIFVGNSWKLAQNLPGPYTGCHMLLLCLAIGRTWQAHLWPQEGYPNWHGSKSVNNKIKLYISVQNLLSSLYTGCSTWFLLWIVILPNVLGGKTPNNHQAARLLKLKWEILCSRMAVEIECCPRDRRSCTSFFCVANHTPYCGWKNSCTNLDGWNPKNNGING